MVYVYQPEFDGFLTAVFEIFAAKDKDAVLEREDSVYIHGLFERHEVQTDEAKARRVEAGLERLSETLPQNLYFAWLSCEEGIDDAILAVIRLGFAWERDPSSMRYNTAVRQVEGAARRVAWERHRFLQFVRFKKTPQGLYFADIDPAYDILHTLAVHFTERFSANHFVIRDTRRNKALTWNTRRWNLLSLPKLADMKLPEDSEFEELWRQYHKVIAIPQRKNLRLQAKFIPKRYRANLTEFEK